MATQPMTARKKAPVEIERLGKLESVVDLFGPTHVGVEVKARQLKRENGWQAREPLLHQRHNKSVNTLGCHVIEEKHDHFNSKSEKQHDIN